jgi:hypothetical protein
MALIPPLAKGVGGFERLFCHIFYYPINYLMFISHPLHWVTVADGFSLPFLIKPTKSEQALVFEIRLTISLINDIISTLLILKVEI